MKRKLIKQGAGGYTITLPISWVRENNLNEMHEIDMEEEGGTLVLSSKASKKEKEIVLDISPYEYRMILNLLNQAYRLGYDKIQIIYKAKEQYKHIEEITHTLLLGFEIVEVKNSHCILQNIAEPNEERFDIILRRMFLQILAVSDMILTRCQQKNYEQGNFLKNKLQIDKLTNYLRRTIIRANQETEKSTPLYAIVSKLSLISHAYTYFYDYAAAHQLSLAEKELVHLTEINAMLRSFYEAFYKKDFETLAQIGLLKQDLEEENNTLLTHAQEKNTVLVAYMREIIRLIHMCTPSTFGYYL